jgi:hypothetical protein
MVVANVRDGTRDHVGIVEHQDLRLEDLRFDLAEALRRVSFDLGDACLCVFASFCEALDLALDVSDRHGYVWRTWRLPMQRHHRTDYDPR